ncbi:PREDICTED: serrate RNA effector molecule-like [Camelina sativa]|uniref:Serrate RNA effector molecule-like n=1 Tax=Camelina sativa TaxID=90675 RepID=A0ABM0Z5S4_CAMSA|nr:PREDICTED: serrate RNA effector molecule-like [Camelina sativa]
MADVTLPPSDSVDNRLPEKSTSSSPPPSSSLPQQEQEHEQQQPPQRRDRDSRERRDDRDLERPPNRRDRDRSPLPPPRRDYKRRPSLSPPPPYRDRRHSPPPPMRRSPPHKRYRRDDNGYDARRGSPRGGYGPPDRRFGYEYGGGYDREMGGRPNYGDERPHGRFMGRHQEWEGGRGGYGDASNSGNNQRDGLMSYKQFIQELEDDILPSEAERRYQEYKAEYITTQKRAYFNTHKEEEWLKNKYHPTNLLSVIERRNDLARKVAKDLLLDLQSGALDLGPAVTALNKSSQTSEQNSEDESAGGKRKRHDRVGAKEADLSAAPKAPSFTSDPKRILTDIEQAQALVRKLDSEKRIEENLLSGSESEKTDREKLHSGSTGPVIIIRGLTSVKGLEGVELLDTLVTYLWRVHGVDYYGKVETNEAKGLRHVRAEGKVSDAKGDESESKFDSHWQERLKGQDPLEVMAAKEKIDAAATEALDPHVRKIRDEKYGWKYGCGAKGCTKLFHAAEFVYKHLKLKHTELVTELTTKVREELYFQNYMNDPNAPGGQPATQQSGPRDRPMRRKPGMENRLRDDRGGRRERDGRNNGNDRNDRSEDQQRGDGDGPDGGNPGEGGYDAFGGQAGVHVPPFLSDINPPPMLMPVPGAGPLGPFVPAPPEVAMQMFRDPSGPNPPFEGSGRGGPAPFLLSPAFRQDPRRLRSYQDLDAPEEEVTVIDYRSL